MSVAQYVIAACISFAMAGGLVWALDRLSLAKSNAPASAHSVRQAVLLYESGILVDTNARGRELVRAAGDQKSGWEFIARTLSDRFPSFPETQFSVERPEVQTFPSVVPKDKSFVVLEQWGNMARITLQEDGDPAPFADAGIGAFQSVLGEAPYPIWQTDTSENVTWANPAYFALAEKLDHSDFEHGIPRVFGRKLATDPHKSVRTAVSDSGKSQSHWYDITTIERNGQKTHYATDANAIVSAEIAQRNFVQTLTKTFAQLSIGLAIFDRNRQLALFNPALIDLTTLPADFLSSRPNLQTFFDRMRENRMMPEPRNYASWREHLAEVIVAASDDRYTETWSLPSGVTYRVVGRPHPDGAIAFLFEDISAEVSLTRRFKADLELGLSALDTMREGVAVFSASGKLGFCNAAFRKLWNVEPELGVTEYTLSEALHHWRQNSERTDAWERLRHHVLDLNPREPWQDDVMLSSGSRITLRVVSLNGGYTSILFTAPKSAVLGRETAEMMVS